MGKLLTKIVRDYNYKYSISYCNFREAMSLPFDGTILIPNRFRRVDDENFLFCTLHEIGHCETYESTQSKLEREFYATQWAIKNSKRYGITISKREQDDWQKYIYSYIQDEDKSKYLLDWSKM